MQRRPLFLLSMLAFGYAFLYGPILSLMVYSFNESRLVTVWGGFSTKWYGELLNNTALLNAAWLSIKIAAIRAWSIDDNLGSYHLRHGLCHRGGAESSGPSGPLVGGGGDGSGGTTAEGFFRDHFTADCPGIGRRLAAGLHPVDG